MGTSVIISGSNGLAMVTPSISMYTKTSFFGYGAGLLWSIIKMLGFWYEDPRRCYSGYEGYVKSSTWWSGVNRSIPATIRASIIVFNQYGESALLHMYLHILSFSSICLRWVNTLKLISNTCFFIYNRVAYVSFTTLCPMFSRINRVWQRYQSNSNS